MVAYYRKFIKNFAKIAKPLTLLTRQQVKFDWIPSHHTAFLPLGSKIGGQINYNRPNAGQFLTREQASYIYKKTESGEIINVDTIQQEIEQDRQLNKIDDPSGDTNPYKELIVNNAEKLEPLMTQM